MGQSGRVMGDVQPPSVRPCAPLSPEEMTMVTPRAPTAAKPLLHAVT